MEIKCQLDATEVFIADLIACSTCFGHHYSHHQELKSIIQWLLSVVFRAVVFKLLLYRNILQTGHITFSSTPDQQLENHSTKYHRQQVLYNTLELLMMGIVVPETCWASNKICTKKTSVAFSWHIKWICRGVFRVFHCSHNIMWEQYYAPYITSILCLMSLMTASC